MKKSLFYISIAISFLAGICGGFLRATQLRNAFDPVTGALISGAPVTTGLIALCIAVAVFGIIGAIFVKLNSSEVPCNESKCICTPIAFSLAAAMILAYAVVIALSLFDAHTNGTPLDITKVVLALFSVYCAVALFFLGKNHMAERNSTAYCVLAAVPVFWACFMLILTFRDKIADPIIAEYVFLIFSYISILFFAYSIAAHVLGKNKRHFAFFSLFVGIFFILTEIVSNVIVFPNLFSDSTKTLEFLAQAAFLVLMPFASAKILKK